MDFAQDGDDTDAAPQPGAPVPLPDGARMVYGLGAARAGLSWLAQVLRMSRTVHVPRNREVHYFDALYGPEAVASYRRKVTVLRRTLDRLGDRPRPEDAEAFRTLANLAETLPIFTDPVHHSGYVGYLTLRKGPRHSLVGDFTPGYAALEAAAFAEMARIGEARFVFQMRDPLARLWSSIRAGAATGAGAGGGEGFAEVCRAAAEDMLDRGALPPAGDYARTLRELLQAVPEERVGLFFHETQFTPDEMGRLGTFLGVTLPVNQGRNVIRAAPPADLPDSLARDLVMELLPQYRFALEVFGDELPAAWSETLDRYL